MMYPPFKLQKYTHKSLTVAIMLVWVLLTVFQKLRSLQLSRIFWVQSFEPNKQHKLLFFLFKMFNITLLQWYIHLVTLRLGKFQYCLLFIHQYWTGQYCLLFTHQYCTCHPFTQFGICTNTLLKLSQQLLHFFKNIQ